MIPLTIATATRVGTRQSTNPWVSSLLAGLATAILSIIFVFCFQTENPVLYGITYLLIGAGPVIGYGIASGRLGSNVSGLIGGLIGGIIPIVSIILWPILVGAFMRTQSIGSLIVGSLIGAVVGLAVFLGMATVMGQDPTVWFAPAVVMLFSFWGGSCGAVMAAWSKDA